MKMPLIILVIVTFLAYMSQRTTLAYEESHRGVDARKRVDIYMVALIVFLILFAGLRTYYNDTLNYIKGFQQSETIRVFLSNSENLNILHNPLFYGFQALIRTFTDNFTVFFMICATIINVLNVRFIKRNTQSSDFALSMFLYVALGTLMLSLAAQKQTLTMAILTLALTQLFEKNYIKYYIIVFLAGLVHSYGWLFLFLPLLDCEIWSMRTYLLLIVTVFIMYTFQNTISSFIEVADQVGKNIATEEVFDGNQMNILRVLVYAVLPLITFIFKGRIQNLKRNQKIFIQMSIISLMFMMLGMIDGANMFGRSANYFEIGIICALPAVIRELFTKQSATFVFIIAICCFTGFYLYDNNGFGNEYRHKSIIQFIGEVI